MGLRERIQGASFLSDSEIQDLLNIICEEEGHIINWPKKGEGIKLYCERCENHIGYVNPETVNAVIFDDLRG